MSDKIFDTIFSDADIKLDSEKFVYPDKYQFGGKIAGLAYAKKILDKFPSEKFPNIIIDIPKYWVIDSVYFDLFVERNNLRNIGENYKSDQLITLAFERAKLPTEILPDLWNIVKNCEKPLAVRSSNLLECDKNNPVVGLYGTKILSNSFEDLNYRFENLKDAVKYIYSTIYFEKTKKYFENSTHKIRDEKLAVLIQEVTGRKLDNIYYPDISGVLKTHDYYTSGKRKPEDRIVNLCLGLGKTIDDKNYSWRYSPKYPKKAPPFNSTREMLHKTQTKFWAINVGNSSVNSIYENEYLIHNDLKVAEDQGALKLIASTYNADHDKVMLGMRIQGPRIINFSTLLKLNENGLNDFINEVSEVSEDVFGCPVRIEFTIVFENVWKFSIVQIRPMKVTEEIVDISDSIFQCDEVLLRADHALGNGTLREIKDIVYVDPAKFNQKDSIKIAQEIERFNQYLLNHNLRYLFIGFGRIGTTDSWLGIPIEWKSLSGAGVIVEATHKNVRAEISKGAHFYQNLSIHKVKYFSVMDDLQTNIDWNWIRQQEIINETNFIKHIKLKNPLTILTDGRQGTGVILK